MNLLSPKQYDRTKFIGGSAIPALLGISKWKTPVQLYFDMVGWPGGQQPIVKPEVQKRYRRGKRLEPIVLDMVAEEQPLIEITARSTDLEPNRYQDADVPYFAAEVDFEWRGEFVVGTSDGDVESWLAEQGNGEIKTVHPFASHSWGAIGTDEIPVEYLAQAQWGLGVTSRDRTLVAALFGADNLQLYRVEADAGLIGMMRGRAQQFMEEHVLAGVPPPPANLADVTRLWPKDDGNKLLCVGDLLAHVQSLRVVQKERKLLEATEEGLEFLIKRVMGERTLLVDEAENELVTWKAGSQSRLDVEAFKTAHPDIYKKFLKKIEFRKFTVKASKE